MLLEFVHDRDVDCPRCGYNLRALTEPRCPECREPLRLQVGVARLKIGWFVVTIVPGAFSGICALILMLPIALIPMTGGGPTPVELYYIDAFGWFSGLVAAAIFLARHRFVHLAVLWQIAWASVMWFVHLVAFGVTLDFII